MLALVVYPIGTWEGFHRRKMLEALARNLRGRGFLLVVEPPLPLLDGRHLRDWRPAARAVVRPLERVTENLWLVRPTLARPGRGAFAAYARAIRGALRRIGPRPDRVAALIFRPDQAWLLGAAGEDHVVYECYDEYRYDGMGQPLPQVAAEDDILLRDVDVVLATSRVLWATRSTLHGNVCYVPNGTSFSLFAEHGDESEVPGDTESVPRPVVGSVGGIHEWVDQDAIHAVATQMGDASFLFLAGDTHFAHPGLKGGLPNLRTVGSRPRHALPRYLQQFDATWCPFQRNAFTRAALPYRVLDALAAGKPVVTHASRSLDDLADVLYFADNVLETVKALRHALDEDCPELIAARQARAREYDWDVLTKRTAEIILESCA